MLEVDSGIVTNTGFSSGFAGSGASLFTDETGLWFFEIDNLVVRKRMRIYELIVNQIRATNGSLFVSSIGTVETSQVVASYPTSGLVAYYPFRADYQFNDYTGNGHLGIAHSTVGEMGTAESIGFNPAYERHVAINSVSKAFTGNTNISFSFDLNLGIVPTSPFMSFVAINSFSGDNVLILGCDDIGRIVVGGTTTTAYSAANLITLGTWVHLALTYNSSTGVIKVYLNGSTIIDTAEITLNFSEDDFWTIGADYDLGPSALGDFLQGYIKDFRIYNRPLTSSEVDALRVTN